MATQSTHLRRSDLKPCPGAAAWETATHYVRDGGGVIRCVYFNLRGRKKELIGDSSGHIEALLTGLSMWSIVKEAYCWMKQSARWLNSRIRASLHHIVMLPCRSYLRPIFCTQKNNIQRSVLERRKKIALHPYKEMLYRWRQIRGQFHGRWQHQDCRTSYTLIKRMRKDRIERVSKSKCIGNNALRAS